MNQLSTPGQITSKLTAAGIVLAAAIIDPEPITKAFLLIAAGFTEILQGLIDGCGETCTAASHIVDQAEPVLKRNVDTYAAQYPRTKTMQAAALRVFDDFWVQISRLCAQVGGPGGKNCVADRMMGACHYHATPASWAKNSSGLFIYTPAGANGSGADCWNWFVGYRDAIAGDPGVIDDTKGGGYMDMGGTDSAGILGQIAGGLIPTSYSVGVGSAGVTASVQGGTRSGGALPISSATGAPYSPVGLYLLLGLAAVLYFRR